MGQLARGSVADRPWGMTLGALGSRGLTGQLTLRSDGKAYRVAFDQGAVVGAHSPLASDAAVRLALTGNLITSTQVADIMRRMAATPDRDEIQLLAELAHLAPEQAQKLRRRLVAQRAARTFSVDRGEFVIEDEISVSVAPGSELDIRGIIYLGAKNNLSEARLAAELDMFGGWFQLKHEALGDLAQYGFTETEKPALRMLLEGAKLADIEAAQPALGERTVRALTYALVSCGACVTQAAAATRGPQQPARPQSGSASLGSRPRRASSPPPGTENWTPRKTPSIPPPIDESVRMQPPIQPLSGPDASPVSELDAPPDAAVRFASDAPAASAPYAPSREPRPPRAAAPPRRAKRNTASSNEIEQLLATKVPLLDGSADHYTLLGLPQSASPDEIRQTYFSLARKLHPDRLTAIGVVDEARNAQRLMAQINAAFAVLNDPARRDEYLSVLARGGEAAVRAQDSQADEMAIRVLQAEEVFRQGEMALRRDQIPQAIAAFRQAVELQPNESEYQALLAWATFAAATDKTALANQTRKALTKAAETNERSPTARFYLGRVERMVGREREALQHFQEVLRIKPNHSEAASEARILEQRLKGKR